MRSYPVQRGLGDSLQIKGLHGPWIMVFLAGHLLVLLLLVVLFVLDVPAMAAITVGALLSALIIALTLRLSKKYGESGLSKSVGLWLMPSHIIVRRHARHLLEDQKVRSDDEP